MSSSSTHVSARRSCTRCATVAVALVACHPSVVTPPPDPSLDDRVATHVQPFVEMADFSGVVLIARGDTVLLRRAFGGGSVNAPYAVGSIAKTVTAAEIDRLVRDGRMETQAPIGRYVPGLPYGDRVTVGQLLDHRGGVPDYYTFPEFAARHGESIAVADLVAMIAAKPLDFEPGSEERYSNSGYALLAAAIEHVTRHRYADAVAADILAPAGMTRSGDLTAGSPPELVVGRDPGFRPQSVQPAAPLGAGWLVGNGSLYATADDLLPWVRWNRSRTAPAGWGLHEHRGHRVLEQVGRISGYAAYAGVSFDDELVVIVLDSIQCQAVETIASDLFELARGHVLPVATRRGTNDSTSGLAAFAGRYQIVPGFTVEVTLVDRGLALAGPDGIALPLDRVGATEFFYRSLYVPIGFEQVGDAPASAIVWSGTRFGRAED